MEERKDIDDILGTPLNGEKSDRERRARWARYCRLIALAAGAVCIYAVVEFIMNLMK